jgi:hypothetical protein
MLKNCTLLLLISFKGCSMGILNFTAWMAKRDLCPLNEGFLAVLKNLKYFKILNFFFHGLYGFLFPSSAHITPRQILLGSMCTCICLIYFSVDFSKTHQWIIITVEYIFIYMWYVSEKGTLWVNVHYFATFKNHLRLRRTDKHHRNVITMLHVIHLFKNVKQYKLAILHVNA